MAARRNLFVCRKNSREIQGGERGADTSARAAGPPGTDRVALRTCNRRNSNVIRRQRWRKPVGGTHVVRLFNRRDRSDWFKKMFKNIPPKAHQEVIDEIVGVLRQSREVSDIRSAPL